MSLAEKPMVQADDEPKLERGLKQRHVTMIGFGASQGTENHVPLGICCGVRHPGGLAQLGW